MTELSTANVARFPKTPARKPATRTHSRHFNRKMQRQGRATKLVGAVAATLVGLSLSHLAHGIELVTSCPTWEGWAMAVGIDLGFISLEAAALTASTDRLRRQVERFTRPTIAATIAGSSAMNAYAFAAQAPADWRAWAAMGIGAAIPALIYALSRVGAAMYMDGHSKA